MNTRIVLIGYGNMGKAFLKGMIRKCVFSPDEIVISSPTIASLQDAKDSYGVSITTDNTVAAQRADIILLCVKPQKMKHVLQEISPHIQNKTLVMSLAAGVSIQSILKEIGKKKQPIVRVMPNIGVMMGMGVSGWIANTYVTLSQKHQVMRILDALGIRYEVEKEEMMDVVTAVTGSGPAYYYYLTEALIDSAVILGIDRQNAEKLVIQTFIGAAELMKKRAESPSSLRVSVTSKGGTTEAAIKTYREKQFFLIAHEAILSAIKRAKDLSM